MRRITTLIATAGAVLIAAGMLTGCAGGATPGETAVADLELDAAWLDSGRTIAVVTEGSSTCVPVAEEATFADGVLSVSFVDPSAGETEQACTRDLVPRATLVGVPEGVDPAQGVSIDVTYGNAAGSIELSGVEGLAGPGSQTEFAPSAGWLQDGSFALVTWGSSSCAPAIETIEKASETDIAVTFATPPADRACTMDMAPRVVLGSVEGVTPAPGVQLVLTGDTFEGAVVPVL